MNKICTSPEQSNVLISLGVDVNTADMFYTIIDQGLYCEIKQGIEPPKDAIPAWSLAALLALLPKEIGRYTKSLYWFDDAWHCEYMDEDSEGLYGTSADNPVDTCVKMIIKLEENNVI